MIVDRPERSDGTTEALLAHLLDQFVESLQDGGEVDPHAALPDRPDLRERVLETYELALSLVTRGSRPLGELDAMTGGDDPAPDGAPARFGDFRLIRRLGAGGMGVVYVAEQESLHRLVALKVVHRGYTISASMRQRFEREAKAIARLRHPNIVTVYATGEIDGTQYLAMELLPGQSLDRVLVEHRTRRQPLPSARFLVWCAEIARALGYAHDQGVVHRDVKPANIHITPDGHALLLDFGLARELDERTMSRTGSFHGTPHYASPEQVRGDRAGPATDVYALGVTLYECLSGKLPFSGRTTERVFHQILTRAAASLRERNAGVSRDLETVVAKAMEKDVVDRYASALDLAEDLEAVLANRPVAARPPGAVRRTAKWARRNPALAAAAIVMVLAVLGSIVALWVARNIAEQQLEEVLRLSDLATVRQLERESEELWPRRPSMRQAMRDWIRRAEELQARRDQHREDRRAAVQRELSRQLAAGLVPPGTTEPDWSEAEQGLRWRVTTGLTLLERLDALDVAGMRERLAFADELATTQARHHPAWKAAIGDIETLPHYRGLRLTPKPGIVPLRRDPVSAMWEFWHVGSGARPELRADGTQWDMRPETGIVLVLLPGGPFVCRRGKEGEFSGELAPFFLSKYEMTQGQWEHFTGVNPNDNKEGGQYPVESVSWEDCQHVLFQMGLQIPTEAQWEYACRAGASTLFATGDTLESLDGSINADGDEDGYPFLAPVGSLRPNAFGFYNMNGNAIEWCRDAPPHGAVELDVAPGDMHRAGPAHEFRITRGGHYRKPREWAELSFYTSTTKTNAMWFLGVRPSLQL